MLMLFPSHPRSPNICFIGDRDRLIGVGDSGDWSSLMSSKFLVGDGVRMMLRPRELDDEVIVS